MNIYRVSKKELTFWNANQLRISLRKFMGIPMGIPKIELESLFN